MLHVVDINWLFLGMVVISACHVQAELLVINMFKGCAYCSWSLCPGICWLLA